MQTNFTLKDLEDISTKINVCTVSENYNVSIYTNVLGGNINAFFRIDYSENNTLGRTVLFNLRTGEQICTSGLNYEDQLIIPKEVLDNIHKSLSVKLELLGQSKTVWENIIDKVNSKHTNDTNNNFEIIPNDLPIPEFKYMETPKKSFLDKLSSIFRKESK